MSKKVLGIYDTREEVIRAIQDYEEMGYPLNQLSIATNTKDFPSPTAIENETGVASEDFGGTDVDEHKGFFESLMSVFRGDFDVDGRTYYEYLLGLGFDDAAARNYAEEIDEGKILLLTENVAASISNPSSTLNEGSSFKPTDLDSNSFGMDEEHSLKLREEQLNIKKEPVQTGEVEVHKEVVEEQKTIDIPVTHEEVYVERRKVDDEVAATLNSADTITPVDDSESIRIPIVEEKVEVTKKPVVNEELVIGKNKIEKTEQVTDQLKREEARIETDGDAIIHDDNTLTDQDKL